MIPKRRKPQRSGIKDDDGPLRCPAHLKWIRGHQCSVPARLVGGFQIPCGGRIEAAHVRTGTDGSMSKKPSDNFTIPLCMMHHKWQTDHGEAAFERMYGISMTKIAEALAAKSPALMRLRNAKP